MATYPAFFQGIQFVACRFLATLEHGRLFPVVLNVFLTAYYNVSAFFPQEFHQFLLALLSLDKLYFLAFFVAAAFFHAIILAAFLALAAFKYLSNNGLRTRLTTLRLRVKGAFCRAINFLLNGFGR